MRWPGDTSLSVRILLLAVLNLALLAALAAFAMGARGPRFRPTDVLMAAAGDGFVNAARAIAEELDAAPVDQRQAIIARASLQYDVELMLCDNEGRRLAGVERAIPGDVIAAFRAPPEGRGGRGRGGRGGPFGPDRMMPPLPPRDGRGPRMPGALPILVRSSQQPRYWVGVRLPIHSAGSPEIIPGTLFFISDALLAQSLFQPWRGLLVVVAAVVLTALCWAPFLRGVTRSVQRIEQATAHIAEGRFDQVPDVRRRDELGRLAMSIQQMAARLDTLVTGQKRFLGDTAHELRSPLARMRLALEILERGDTSDARALVADLGDDVEAMTRLTDDLLEFAHAELAIASARLEPLALHDIVGGAVHAERRAGADIRIDVAPGLRVLADRRHLARAIGNALRNAIDHAASAGPITVSARPAGDRVEIAIADSGPGVPEAALDRIFAPFFRLDESRTRKTGGTGLGLAIVRSSVEACRGTVTCANRTPSGLQVTMTVPGA